MPYSVVIMQLLQSYLFAGFGISHCNSQGSPGTFFPSERFGCKSGFSWTIVASWQMGSLWSSRVSPLILVAVPPLSLGIAAHLLWLTGLPVLSRWGNFASVGRALFKNVFWSSPAHLPVSLWLLWVTFCPYWRLFVCLRLRLYLHASGHLS